CSPFRELNGSWILVATRCPGNLHFLLHGPDLAPVVSWWARTAAAAMGERQKVFILLSMRGVAASPALSNAGQTQRLSFPYARRQRVMVHSVCTELLEGTRQVPVVMAPMMREPDLDPSHCPVSRETEGPVGRRFEHLNQAWCPLAAYSVASFDAHGSTGMAA